MILITLNILLICCLLLIVRGFRPGWFQIVTAILCLGVFVLDLGLNYKKVRVDPVELIQVEFKGQKYEGKPEYKLRPVDKFMKNPGVVVYTNIFGFETPPSEYRDRN